jgi:FkbM family methyltransferase
MKRRIARMIENSFNVRISRPGLSDQYWEEDILKRFFHHFRVDCVFDVGANEGQYAEKLRKKVGFSGPIISFEPIPAAAARLRILADQDVDRYVEEVALDEVERSASFNVMFSSQFSSLKKPSTDDIAIFEQDNKVLSEIVMKTRTVEEYYNKYAPILGFKRPFLKMDTQGHDVSVAKGAGSVLGSFVGLQSELSFKKIYDESLRYDEALAFYDQAGFELSAFVPNNAGVFPMIVEMDCIMYNRSM